MTGEWLQVLDGLVTIQHKLILFKDTQYSQNMKHGVFHLTIPTVCSETVS
jgi:hypothetical protein